MTRPICFDLTHLSARLHIPWPSGIDKVDLAYALHFSERSLGPFIRYRGPSPQVLSTTAAHEIVASGKSAQWQGGDAADDANFVRLRDFLTGAPALVRNSAPSSNADRPGPTWVAGLMRKMAGFGIRRPDGAGDVPPGAIYLNVAQHQFEHHEYFEWLHARRDVVAVFLIHDLLPLDYPEFFLPREASLFERRVQMAFRHGKAFIVTSQAVRHRLERELACRGHDAVPIAVLPLPSTLGNDPASSLDDPALAATPYFVTLGTIEPRKNHLLLLSLWRHMAEASVVTGAPVPKLVIVGGRGWENEQVIDVLERGRLTRPHVIEASGLSSAGLSTLIANARALLMPSFAEGYGLPLVEALSIGTPVVTTNAPVFREVTQGCATYLSPVDGLGWEKAIQTLSDATSPESRDARACVQRFRSPTWQGYFRMVDDFLATLP